MTTFDDVQMLARNTVGDVTWQDQISTLDEETLRHLAASLASQQNLFLRRERYVRMLLDLGPQHGCDCDRRWTSEDVPHQEGCDVLKACTCERRWTGGALHARDHSSDCDVRSIQGSLR